ncbi:MAG: prolipoprotein diacylglyceryl transferase, partial [Spirochaetes bacterium]|nr:prolipoprotein diacylglyceryl transferase [Spirochaetota bacterium]
MIPILLVIPKFSFVTFILLALLVSFLFVLIFFLFRKRTPSVKVFKNDLTGYYFFTMVIVTLLFFFAPFPVRTYGVAVALGFLSAILVSRKLCKRSDINPDVVFDLAVYVLVGTILGARLFYVIFYEWSYFLSNPLSIFKVWEGGLVFYGGL